MSLAVVVKSRAWPFRVHRSNYLLLAGLLAVLVAANMDWYRQPEALASFVDTQNRLVLVEAWSWVEVALRACTFVLALAIGLCLLRSQRSWPLIWRLSLLMLGGLLLFPALRVHWEPQLAIDANLLYLQVDRVVTNMEDMLPLLQTEWRHWLQIDPNFMLAGNTMGLPSTPDWKLSSLTLAQLPVVLDDLFGLSNEFLNLITRWWVVALVGTLMLLFGCYLKSVELDEPGLLGRSRMGWWIAALFVLVIAPRLVGNYYQDLGYEAFVRGNQEEAVKHWRTALSWFPRARYVLSWHFHKGRLEKMKGCDDCFDVFLSDAYLLLQKNRLDEAITLLQRAWELAPGDERIRYWLGYCMIGRGGVAFNRRDYALAREIFQEAVALLPTHAMAWYGLAMAHQQLGLHDEAISNLEQIARLQSYLSFKRLTIKGEVYMARSWAAFRRGDWLGAFDQYRDWLRPESW